MRLRSTRLFLKYAVILINNSLIWYITNTIAAECDKTIFEFLIDLYIIRTKRLINEQLLLQGEMEI